MEYFVAKEIKVRLVKGKVSFSILKAYYICKECKEITHNYTDWFYCDCCGARYFINNDIIDEMEKK